jgi:sulfonate transport system substrate-binding protein
MKSKTRWTLAIVAVCILLAFLAYFRFRPQPNSDVKSISFATFSKALGNTPYLIAKHFNSFSQHPDLKGLSLTYTEYNDRPTISQAFDKGELQVLFSAEIPSILCRAQGNDIRIIELSTVASQEILIRSGLPLRNVMELRGRSMAVLAGTSSHFGLLKILSSASLKPSDLDFRYMGPSEAKVAFETGKIDAWAVWAPWVEQQEITGKGYVLTGGNAEIVSTMTIAASLLNSHEQKARAIVEVVRQSKEWLLANPEEAQRIAAAELNLDLAVVKQAWPKFRWGSRLSESNISDFQEKANFLAAEDKTRKAKAVDIKRDLVDLRFVKP